MRHALPMIGIALTLTALAACAGDTSGGEQADPAARATLRVKGSTTMQPLAFEWAREFMAREEGHPVVVTGGGSGTGIQAVLDGTVDVACSSRPVDQAELAEAANRGVELEQTQVAWDAIAIVVHAGNPVEALSTEQLREVFSGRIQSWNELGGAHDEIQVVSRDPSSGTYVFFQEHVLAGDGYSRRALRTSSNASLAHVVSTSEHAVGYVGLAFVPESGRELRVVPVSDDEHPDGVVPSAETVRDRSYPLRRELYLVYRADAGEVVTTFVELVLGAEGQRVVAEQGLTPIG